MSDATKTCSKCRRTFPRSEFFRDRQKRDGLSSQCKGCKSATALAWRERNAERFAAYQGQWQKLNRERRRRSQRKFHDTPKGKKHGRQDHLMRRYGLTLEDYDDMAQHQDNRCAVCGLWETSIDHRTNEAKRLAVDHDHTTGEVRALLCSRCNGVLGRVDDDPDLLRMLAAYLEAFS